MRSMQLIGVTDLLQPMDTSRYRKQTFYRKSATTLAVIFLAGRLAFAGPAGMPAPQPNPGTALPTNSLPSKIITTDGVTYNAPKLSRIEPDGLVVEFRPDAGGAGLAKLKFAKLPESLQKQFGYDPRKASAYEHEQKLAMSALTQQLQQDERARAATMTLLNEASQRPNLAGAVSVSTADPTVTYTYYAPDQKPALLNSNVATCQHSYQCHADFDVRVEQSAVGQPLHFSIDKVSISLEMSCHIYLPESPYEFITIHEEGHRKIYEYFYRLGPKLADRIGESMIGKEYTSSEATFEYAKARALGEAEKQVQIQYLPRLESVAWAADNYYGELTDYGANNMDRNQAYQEAVDKFGKDFPD
jgi:hypothetical protein